MARKPSKEDEDLRKALAELDGTASPPEGKKRILERSWKGTILFLAAAIVIIALLTVIYQQQQQLYALEEQRAELGEEVDMLRVQNFFYRDAYELVLRDMEEISKIYGGQQRYHELQQEVREKELDLVLSQTDTEERSMRNAQIWQEYVEKGVINTSCLGPIQPVRTVSNATRLTIGAYAENPSDVSIYIDANNLESLRVDGSTQVHIETDLSEGVHAIDLVSAQGRVEIQDVLLDTKEISLKNATIDYGRHWSVFDCRNTTTGQMIGNPGALRLLIQKH